MGNFYTDVIQKDARFRSTKRVGDPALLEPNTRAAVEAVIADAAAHGIKLMIFETYRSQERQVELFNQHASQLKKVGVHHYGLACDIVKDVNGEPSWKGSFSFLQALAKAHGLIWGGDWGTPNVHHSFQDTDHVQRCSVADQAKLFRGEWYPDADYNPYTEAGGPPKAAPAAATAPAKSKPAAKAASKKKPAAAKKAAGAK
jgi:D-alanyl-D-alanine carboxypeptidase